MTSYNRQIKRQNMKNDSKRDFVPQVPTGTQQRKFDDGSMGWRRARTPFPLPHPFRRRLNGCVMKPFRCKDINCYLARGMAKGKSNDKPGEGKNRKCV
jgi:hypothetical protein